MDFICACLLIFLWFVRPQDIFSVISGVSLVKYLMYAGIIATFRRPSGLTAAKVWATPMDWLVTAYCVWAIYTTDDHTAAFKDVFTYFSFHVVTALALNSWSRIETYLNCWMMCLGTLALLAVSTHWGFEMVKGSSELTMIFHNRLTLNTWIFRNPNALGHGVITLISAGMAWFLMSGSKLRVLGMVMIAIGMHCVLLTESKGAFLAGAGGLTLLFLFKRPVWFQIAVLLVVYGVGLAALKSLPRMNTLSKDDEGIQGRMLVWRQAKGIMESTTTGVGLKTFQGFVPVRVASLHRTIYIPIATHGSYVRHGADLGYIGLMLFAGIFYGGARVLLTARTEPGSEALRAQRAIYGILATTAISCWVVDRAYHMDFYLLSGLVSAFHRRFLPPEKMGDEEDEEESNETGTGKGTPALALPSATAAAKTTTAAPGAVEAVPGAGSPGSGAGSGPEGAVGTATPNAPTSSSASVETATSPGTAASAIASVSPASARAEAPRSTPQVAARQDPRPAENTSPEDENAADAEPDEHGAIRLKWDRISWVDLVMMYLLLEVLLYYWDLFSTDFIVF